MRRRQFYKTVITVAGILMLAVGGFAQGKGHGGGGDKHGGGGGDHGNGRGGEQRQWQGGGDRGDHGRGNGNGNGNGWGRNKGGDDGQRQVWAQQRAIQEQQRQNDWNARRQQQDAVRQQQQAYRQQQESMRRQYESQRQQYRQPENWNDDRGRGHGRKNGWNDDRPRGNAYGARGIWPGEFRGWRDPDKQLRKAQRDAEKQYRNSQSYYAYDPLVTWTPRDYRPQVYYNNNYYNGRNQTYYGGYAAPARENIVRTIISSFFGGGDPYGSSYYQPAYTSPAYGNYAPSYSYGYDPYASSYNPLGYSYYPAGYTYSTASYSPYNTGGYYDPYSSPYASPLLGSQLFGGGGLKSTLLNVGLQMLQGFLGQGYQQGVYDGQYARQYPRSDYYDPYAPADAALYSPYASSLADQRRVFDEGYKLGYQDALRNQDPYGAMYGNGDRTNLITQFLANSLLAG